MELKRVLEAIFFSYPEPLGIKDLQRLLPEWNKEDLEKALKELIRDYESFGLSFKLEEVAGGYQFRTLPEYAPWVRRAKKVTPLRLSKAALEVLAIIAYKQPITRAEVESIRGVDSGGVIGSLLEKGLIKPLGRKETPRRPLLYGTTNKFLEVFGLKSLEDLPSLREIEGLEGK